MMCCKIERGKQLSSPLAWGAWWWRPFLSKLSCFGFGLHLLSFLFHFHLFSFRWLITFFCRHSLLWPEFTWRKYIANTWCYLGNLQWWSCESIDLGTTTYRFAHMLSNQGSHFCSMSSSKLCEAFALDGLSKKEGKLFWWVHCIYHSVHISTTWSDAFCFFISS